MHAGRWPDHVGDGNPPAGRLFSRQALSFAWARGQATQGRVALARSRPPDYGLGEPASSFAAGGSMGAPAVVQIAMSKWLT
jgi:hypothetical protein